MNSLEPLNVTPEVINALNILRNVARTGPGRREALTWAITTLDEAGVFAEIDEVTGYDVLAFERPEAGESPWTGRPLDAAEWEDVTRVDHPIVVKCRSCGLRVADGSEYHESCRPYTGG